MQSVLGVEPGSAVVRPPEGALDDAAVTALVALGATTILGDADTVERPPQPNEFAPPPTATLAVGGQTVDLVLPDPGTQALLAQPGFLEDAVRAAQASIGELATIWQEQPVPSQPRGVSVLVACGSSRHGSGARSSGGWRPRRSSGRSPRRSGGAGPAACGAERRSSRPRDRALLAPRTSKTSSTRGATCWRSDPCSWSRHPCPTGSVATCCTPSPASTSATRPRGRRGSTTSNAVTPRRLLARRARHQPGLHVPVRDRVDPAADGRPRRAPDPVLAAAPVEPVPLPRG